jgi:hypothetical protein
MTLNGMTLPSAVFTRHVLRRALILVVVRDSEPA